MVAGQRIFITTQRWWFSLHALPNTQRFVRNGADTTWNGCKFTCFVTVLLYTTPTSRLVVQLCHCYLACFYPPFSFTDIDFSFVSLSFFFLRSNTMQAIGTFPKIHLLRPEAMQHKKKSRHLLGPTCMVHVEKCSVIKCIFEM